MVEAAGVELHKRLCFCNLRILQDRKNPKIDDSQGHRTVIVQSATQLVIRRGFPEMHANPDIDIVAFYNSYVATYFERDVALAGPSPVWGISSASCSSCALRSANLLNKIALAVAAWE